MRYSIVFLLATCVAPLPTFGQRSEAPSARIDGYHEFNYGEVRSGIDQWTQAIRVTEPELRSEVHGDVPVKFQASGMTRATAFCWSQGDPPNRWGEDVNLTPEGIALDVEGNGSFVFPADGFPHGPVNVRIYAHNEKDRKDIFELQLFNAGGVVWNEGIPDRAPHTHQVSSKSNCSTSLSNSNVPGLERLSRRHVFVKVACISVSTRFNSAA